MRQSIRRDVDERRGLDRQPDLDGRALARSGVDRQRRGRAVLAGQTPLDVAQADPVVAAPLQRFRRSNAGAGVADDQGRVRECRPSMIDPRAGSTLRRRLLRRDAVLDRVLDERLQHQRRNADAPAAPWARRCVTRSRCSNRARSMSRYASTSSSSRPSVVNSPSERSTPRSSDVSRISVSQRASAAPSESGSRSSSAR